MNSKPLSISGPNSIHNETGVIDISRFRPPQIAEMPLSADNSEHYAAQVSFENNDKMSPE